jgi:hypothetical protein
MVLKKEREFARRQHRSLALVLMIHCWVKKAAVLADSEQELVGDV